MDEPISNADRNPEQIPLAHLGLEDRHPLLPADIASRLSIEEQAGFFFTLVDSAADAIVAHQPDGSIVYANAEAAALLGYTHERELIALPSYGWVAPTQLQSAPRRIERILADGLLTFESGVRCKDGTVIPTEVRSRRVDTPLGPIVIAVIRDVSERVRNRAALEHLAYHDALTGLSNRVHLEDRLVLAIADSRRYGDRLAMAYIDLDRFKPVNDRFGHAVGDEVLIEVGRRLRAGVREQDTVARLGGDEFVVVFPRLASTTEVELVVDRLVRRIMEPIQVGVHEIVVSASIGIAVFDPSIDDARSLLVKADIAMYSAKLDPEHPWLTFVPGMSLPEGDDVMHPHEAPALDVKPPSDE